MNKAEEIVASIINQIEKATTISLRAGESVENSMRNSMRNKYLYYVLNTEKASKLYSDIKSLINLDKELKDMVIERAKLGLYILKSGRFRLTLLGVDYTAEKVEDLKILYILLFQCFCMGKEEELASVLTLISRLKQEGKIIVDLNSIETALKNLQP